MRQGHNRLGILVQRQLTVMGLRNGSFAQRIGISRGSLVGLIYGRQHPSPEQMHRLAVGLHLPVEVLAELDEELDDLEDWAADVNEQHALIQGFVMRNSDLSPEETRALLRVAQAAVDLGLTRRYIRHWSVTRP